MTESPANTIFERLLHKLEPQSRLLRSWPLKGGVSAQVTALEVEQSDGEIKKMIVRQHGAVDLAHNPQIAADEFKLLQLLHATGLAVPTPYYVDQSNEILSTPYVVIEYIEGESEFAPRDLDDFLLQCAIHLSSIHQIDDSKSELSFLPQQAQIAAEVLQTGPTDVVSHDEQRSWDILQAVWPLPQHNRSMLLHGDFWPGNLLWKEGRLVAVIDWEDARIGDPLSDLANSRLEMLCAFGVDAMHRFTNLYQSRAPINMVSLPYWDLYCSLGRAAQIGTWGLDEDAEQRMRAGLRAFVSQAIDEVGEMSNSA